VRQFLTWQFWLSLAALAALTIGLVVITRTTETDEETLVAAALGDSSTESAGVKSEQPIDLIVLVFAAQADPGFDIVNGRSTARVVIYIDGFRYMDIPAGTPGENRCGELDKLARCVVAADVLGDAVLWFSFLPLEPRNLITLPGISGIRDGNKAILQNGWLVTRAPVLQRDTEACGTDTVGLNDFLERFAEQSITTFNMDEQRITKVTCIAPA
jgi:hypothetical protein